MGVQTLRLKNCQNHKRAWNQQFYTIISLRWEVWSENFMKCLICRVVVRVKSYCCSAQDRTGWQCSWSSVEGRILQSCLASWSVVQLSVRWLRLTTQLVFYDNNGLESRSDGDWPYGRTQNTSKLYLLRHCGSTTFFTDCRSSLFFDDQLPGWSCQ